MAAYFIRNRSGVSGPFAASQLRTMWDSGIVTSDTEVRREAHEVWTPLTELISLPEHVDASRSRPPARAASAIRGGTLDGKVTPSRRYFKGEHYQPDYVPKHKRKTTWLQSIIYATACVTAIAVCSYGISSCSPVENSDHFYLASERGFPATVSPPPKDPPIYDAEIVRRGEAIHARAMARTHDARLDVWGGGFASVKACIWIPEDEWQALSSDDRMALATYLKAQVPKIRSNPDQYVGVHRSAPMYARIRSNIATMQDGAYVLFTMVERDGQWVQSRTVSESH